MIRIIPGSYLLETGVSWNYDKRYYELKTSMVGVGVLTDFGAHLG